MIDIHHSQRDVPGAITLSLCRVQVRESWLAEATANARLIAAAPDLLAALHAFPGFTDDANIGDVWLERCRAAIAKATGAA
jgi:hypothetical protein